MENLPQNVWQNVWIIYPKIYGKIYGNPTTHLGGVIPEMVRNRDRFFNFDIGFLSWPISESAVPPGNLDDLGGGRVPGLAGGWLAAEEAKKCWNQKIL